MSSSPLSSGVQDGRHLRVLRASDAARCLCRQNVGLHELFSEFERSVGFPDEACRCSLIKVVWVCAGRSRALSGGDSQCSLIEVDAIAFVLNFEILSVQSISSFMKRSLVFQLFR